MIDTTYRWGLINGAAVGVVGGVMSFVLQRHRPGFEWHDLLVYGLIAGGTWIALATVHWWIRRRTLRQTR